MSKQNLKSILENLSPNLKQAFYSDHTSEIIKDAAILGQIRPDDTSLLNIIEGDVIDVILGRISLNKFLETLKMHLNIPETNVIIINKIIQEKLFNPLKADLDQLKINKSEIIFPITQRSSKTIIQKTTEETPQHIKEVLSQNEPKRKVKAVEFINPQPSLQPTPDLSLPEVPNIEIERPIAKTKELKKVTVPSVSSEERERIHSKLLEAISKKESQPKIAEQMKKVIAEGISKPQAQKPKTKEVQELSASKVVEGEGAKFTPQESTQKSPIQTPYILDVKLQEEQEKEKKISKEEPIQYRKYKPQKPFGEA
jgi:hypothetical protein